MEKIKLIVSFIVLTVCYAVANANEKVSPAIEITDEDNITYSLLGDSKTASVTKASGTITEAKIKASIKYNNEEYVVTSIGEDAFYNCLSLKHVVIPNTVTLIDAGAFYNCRSLGSVVIPNSVTTIGSSAFSYTGITSIEIPNSVTTIGGYAFSTCPGLREINIPNSVTYIGAYAFAYSANLEYVNLPIYLTSPIGEMMFAECEKLKSIAIGNNVPSIDRMAFWKCNSLKSVTIGKSVTTIGFAAFEECINLASVVIPNSVVSIESDAFRACIVLDRITIPNSVTFVGDAAFSNCRNLKDLFSEAVNPPSTEGKICFSPEPESVTLHVPVGSKKLYAQAENWRDFGNIVEDINLSGVECVASDFMEPDAIYYDLNGVIVKYPEHGIYIRCQGDKVSKVIL